MYPARLRVTCLAGLSMASGWFGRAEAPPLLPGRLQVEADGVVCEYSPGEYEIARALAARMAALLHEEAGKAPAGEQGPARAPLDAYDLMDNREAYLAAIARHLALPAPLATQEECYLAFGDYGLALEEMKMLGRRSVRDLRQARSLALWKRDDLLARLRAGQSIEGFTLDAVSGEIEATFGANLALGSSRLKEAALRMKNLQRRYSYKTTLAQGRAITTAHVAPKGAQPSRGKREPATTAGTTYATKWPFNLHEDLLLLPIDQAVDRLIEEGYRQPLAAFERMVARIQASDPNHAFLLLHETIEIGLIDAYIASGDRRWFCDGVANYLAWRVVGDLHGVERANRMYNLPAQLARYAPLRGKIDLARWPSAEAESADENDGELSRAHYAFATRAVALMHERQGPDILVRLLREVGETERNATSMLTVERAWHELTGTSLDGLLEEAVAQP